MPILTLQQKNNQIEKPVEFPYGYHTQLYINNEAQDGIMHERSAVASPTFTIMLNRK